MTFPHFVIYTTKGMGQASAKANGPMIRIRPEFEDSWPLFEHEYEHVKQWYKTLGTHSIWYALSKKYRLKTEAQAYAAQVRAGANLDAMALNLCGPLYKLGINKQQAKAEISKYI